MIHTSNSSFSIWVESKHYSNTLVFIFALLHTRSTDSARAQGKGGKIKEDQDVVGILTTIRDLTHSLKQKKFGTMAIVECEYELDTTTQALGDTIEWFHRIFLVQLATSRAHGGVP